MQLLNVITLAAALVSAVSGASLEGRARRTCVKQNKRVANFDDVKYNILAPLAPVLNEVGTYKGLKFNNFGGLKFVGLPAGIVPSSGDQAVMTGLVGDLLHGTASIQPTGSMTYFDLKSFHYGCAIGVGLKDLIPTACTVRVKAYYQGKLQVQRAYKYSPNGLLLSDGKKALAQKAECHTDLMGVDRVEFTTDNPLLNVLVLDDITFVPSKCTQ